MIRNVSLVVILNCIGLLNAFAMQSKLGKRSKQWCPKSQGGAPIKKKKIESFRNQAVQQFEDVARGRAPFTEELRSFIMKNPNIKDEQHNTLLHNALKFHNQRLIVELIQNPLLDINVRNDDNESLLKLAIHANNVEAVKLILERKPKSSNAYNIFALDVFENRQVALAIGQQVAKLIEDFTPSLSNISELTLFKKAQNGQVAYSKQSQQRDLLVCDLSQHVEKFEKISRAKQSLQQYPDRLGVFFDFNQEDDSNWKENFTEEEIFLLCSAFTEGNFYWLLKLSRGQNQNANFHFGMFPDFLMYSDLGLAGLRLLGEFNDEFVQQFIRDFEMMPPLAKAIMLFDHFDNIKKQQIEQIVTDENAWLVNALIVRNNFFDTVLHRAVEKNDIDLVNILLEKKPNLKIKNIHGHTAFYIACFKAFEREDRRVFEAFLPYITKEDWNDVANSLVRSKSNDDTCRRMFADLVPYIDIEDQDSMGNTFLHRAILSGKIEMVKEVLKHNPSINAQNKKGDTPLLLACKLIISVEESKWKNFDSMISELFLHHADFNIQNNDGKSYSSFSVERSLKGRV